MELQPITITLDGREVSGYPGTTILELAGESGITIPTLCHNAHLTPVGACRICLVEDEKTGRLHASCVTEIAPGMIINTQSPRVIEHRRTIIKLILASHPDVCLVCDKGNNCQLRQIAADLGIGLIDFERIPKAATIEEVNPFIERDLSKCILCARCIRACQELVVEGAVSYFKRGFTAKAATLYDLPLEDSECTFCGTCVAMCPTGALMEKDRAYSGSSRTIVDTTCPYCGCGCSLHLEVKGNRLLRAAPGEENGVNRGTLCARGSYGLGFVNSPDRLTRPLARLEGNLGPVSWDDALDRAAAGLKSVRDKYGPDSLAVLGSPRCTNEENYLLQRFARGVLGTSNIDTTGRLPEAFLPYYQADPLKAVEESEVIIVAGADLTASAPIIGYAIKRAVKSNKIKLILIDSRRTALAPFAHLWLRPAAGTDVVLLNGLARVIIDEDLLDRDFVIRNTGNYPEFTRALAEYGPENIESITGLPAAIVRSAARLYATAARAAIIHSPGATDNVLKALSNLAILTGKSSGFHVVPGESNSLGASEMGARPDFLPGYASIADATARKKFEDRWQVKLPSTPGLTTPETIEQAVKGKIKAMYIIGDNPVLSFPDGRKVAEALSSLEFLVVQDLFLTETASLASVVLPAASFAEKEGTFTGLGGRTNHLRKAIEPAGESRPDWEIVLDLAARMGQPMPFSSLEQVTDEINEMAPFDKDSPAARAALNFYPVEYTLPAEKKDGYSFTLLTGPIQHLFGSGTRSSRASRLRKYTPGAYLEIGEADARRLKISDGDRVSIISPVDSLSAAVRITDGLPEGVVFMPSSFPEAPVNRLFDITLDPETKTPLPEICRVKVERAQSDG